MIRRLAAAAAAAVTLTVAVSALAEVPRQVHYQGIVSSTVSGEPLHCPDPMSCDTEPLDVTFRLYDAPEDGLIVWEEVHTALPIVHGVFHAVLGEVEPLLPTLLESGAVWLALDLNDTGELSPRQALVSAPYAIFADHAQDAATLGGQAPDAFAAKQWVVDWTTTYVAPLNDALSDLPAVAISGSFDDFEDIPPGFADGVDDDQLGALDCAPDEIARFDGVVWVCDVDRVLTEGDVDELVANNGFAIAADLAPVATAGTYDSLTGTPDHSVFAVTRDRVPVGSIVPFHPDITSPPLPVPEGWVACDGAAISAPQAYEPGGIGAGLAAGSLTAPDLNGAAAAGLRGRFLRGHGQSGLSEADQFGSHVHAAGNLVTGTAGGHTHVAAAALVPGTTNVNKGDSDDNLSLTKGSLSFAQAGVANTHTHTITGDSASAGGAETRPHNYSVVFILRVY